MNKLILLGHLTKDIEISKTEKGTTIGKTCIAVNEYNKDVMFVNCKMFNSIAEVSSKYLKKGSQVLLEGKLSISNYIDDNGNKKQYTEILVSNVEWISQSFNSSNNDNSIKQDKKEISQEYTNKDNNIKYDYNDDEIPF